MDVSGDVECLIAHGACNIHLPVLGASFYFTLNQSLPWIDKATDQFSLLDLMFHATFIGDRPHHAMVCPWFTLLIGHFYHPEVFSTCNRTRLAWPWHDYFSFNRLVMLSPPTIGMLREHRAPTVYPFFKTCRTLDDHVVLPPSMLCTLSLGD